jgi:hypothetical protein
VLWKVVSSDGHPTSGQFTFTVEGAVQPTPTESATAGPTETAGPAPTPTESFTPGPPMESESTDAPAWPWIVAGLVAAAVLGAVIYLLASRARREKALDEGAAGAADQGSGPGSDSPVDH